jgi:hypothetical protein
MGKKGAKQGKEEKKKREGRRRSWKPLAARAQRSRSTTLLPNPATSPWREAGRRRAHTAPPSHQTTTTHPVSAGRSIRRHRAQIEL